MESIGFILKTEVYGNSGVNIIYTLSIFLYYIVVSLKFFNIEKALVYLLAISIVSILFLPVRKNISVIQSIEFDAKTYWVTRPYWGDGIKVYSSEYVIFFLKPRAIYSSGENIKIAKLTTSNGSVQLEISRAGDQDLEVVSL